MLVLAIGTGVVTAYSPGLGAVALGLLLAPLGLVLPLEVVIACALAAALYGPLIGSFGIGGVAVFLHVPLVVVASISAALRNDERITLRGFGPLLLLFVVVSLVSALTSDAPTLRTSVFLLNIVEPFLLIWASLSLRQVQANRLRKALVWMALLEVPLALVQLTESGIGDSVAGSLVGKGAGAHVLGGVTAVAAMLAIAIPRPAIRAQAMLLLPLVLLGVSVIADAKQVLFALAVAVAVTAMSRIRSARSAAVALALAVVIVVGTGVFSPFQALFSGEALQAAVSAKSSATALTLDELGGDRLMLGLGPGNGISRAALSSVPGYSRLPDYLVSTSPSEFAATAFRGYASRTVTSVESPLSSWLGLVSDIGVLGLASYLSLAILLWLAAGRLPTTDAFVARSLLLFSGILGVMFTWLEEPTFSLFVAAALGVCLTASRPESVRGRGEHAGSPPHF